MTAPYVVVADRDPQSRPGEPVVERTVFLRRQAHAWVVSLDEALLLSTIDEDEAFRCACHARRVEGGEPLRLLILSGPSAAVYECPGVDPNDAQPADKPTSDSASGHHDQGSCAPPRRRAGVTA